MNELLLPLCTPSSLSSPSASPTIQSQIVVCTSAARTRPGRLTFYSCFLCLTLVIFAPQCQHPAPPATSGSHSPPSLVLSLLLPVAIKQTHIAELSCLPRPAF